MPAYVYQEYPKMLYDAQGASRIVNSPEQEAAAGPDWRFRADGSDPNPSAVTKPEPEKPKGKGKPDAAE